MKIERDDGKIDGVRLRCNNNLCYKSENVRDGTPFSHLRLSLPIIYRVIFIEFLNRTPQRNVAN